MRLAEFIQTNHTSIIEAWVNFARSMVPWAEGMSETDLQDHARDLLIAVVNDIRKTQTALEQSEKSKGQAEDGKLAQIGQKHASDRLESGLSLKQLVSEYRALRASVLRQWDETQGNETGDVTRFNESIDEALATSINRYSETVDNTREQFLAILGHDLRNPIGAITMGATLLAEPQSNDVIEIANLMLGAAERMNRMVNDLLDLTRTRLGAGIPVTQKPMDLTPVCRQIVSELQPSHPDFQLRFESIGDLHGEWDSDRLAQVVSNLVANALQYGSSAKPVKLVAREKGQEVILQVHNEGLPIPENALKTIFTPMARHGSGAQSVDRNSRGLGLGLFIASEIVISHGGTINATSTEKEGTTFTVTLPRHPASKPAQPNASY
ncbi:MAG TPA: sensor histidine kinase [Oligoflexus sp.]|uniref:sensor histidine kinase n=1 Tax=Oligoflexus sp. TaxID=1971216 RepID=UPI002D4872C9|nr:sensor histidine kinase [Oligoflexus sp.]HYX31483.1 sensor histidine kinase [Oligoflexus sp.]